MKIGILTSGGDTPGMNAVIRAAYIQCQRLGHTLVGFKYGWKGLMENITMEIPAGIIDEVDMGGTLLGSARENPYARDDGVDKKEAVTPGHVPIAQRRELLLTSRIDDV